MSETSPAGEAGGGNGSGGNSSSVECPTCGDTFSFDRAMKSHHTQVHGESLSRVSRECEYCGSEFDVHGCRSDNAKYCSRGCMSRAFSDGTTVHNCDYCGDGYEKKPYENAGKYCSLECFHKSERQSYDAGDMGKFTCPDCGKSYASKYGIKYHLETSGCVGVKCPECGETSHWSVQGMRQHYAHNHGGSLATTTVECDYCGAEGEDYKSNISQYDHWFCSNECSHNWLGEQQRGENHPNWKGGCVEYYGPNWATQRDKARDRDQHRCQRCRKTAKEMGREPDVHHIRRLGWFKTKYDSPEWWERGNSLDNLITLCRSCHLQWEGIPLRPDNRKP